MKGQTIKLTMDRADYGVTVANNVALQYNSIMSVKVPAGLAYVLLNHTAFTFYPCTAADTKFTARNGSLIIGFKGAGDTLVKELYRWDYGTFHDLTIANQKNQNYREMVSLNMPHNYVIAREDEQLIIQLYHSQIMDVSEAGNVIEFNVQKIILA